MTQENIKDVKTAESIIEQYYLFNTSTGNSNARANKGYIIAAMEEYSSLRNALLIEENRKLREALGDIEPLAYSGYHHNYGSITANKNDHGYGDKLKNAQSLLSNKEQV